MRCPYCGDENDRVIDSRVGREGSEIRRRRECAKCERRFTTRERVEEIWPKVVKQSDERREEYDQEKLIKSIQRACVKRPVSTDAVQQLVDRIEKWMLESGEKEVPSARIGALVVEELIPLDWVAASRFASVFHNFQGAEDYAKFFTKAKAVAKKLAEPNPAQNSDSASS